MSPIPIVNMQMTGRRKEWFIVYARNMDAAKEAIARATQMRATSYKLSVQGNIIAEVTRAPK